MPGLNQQGQFWDRVTEQAQPLAEALRLIVSLVPADAIRERDILDAGCGAGDYSAAFAQAGARSVTALDVSTGSLRLAHGKTPTGRFARASLSELPYRSASFDVIWSWGVLHYVPDAQAAMRGIVRVLRPGGVAVIHTLRAGFWSSLELTGAKWFSAAPHWVEPVVLSAGEWIVPLATRVLTGQRPEEQTSKTIRQKLHERLFVPGNQKTFSVEQLVGGFGPSVETAEAHPPVADLLKRDMSVTMIVRKPHSAALVR